MGSPGSYVASGRAGRAFLRGVALGGAAVAFLLATWNPPLRLGHPVVEVWVDQSDSTRGAGYRSAEIPVGFVVKRIGNGEGWPVVGKGTDAVIALTDGRLGPMPETGVPVSFVRDGRLEELAAKDAAVVSLEEVGGRVEAVVRGPSGATYEWTVDGVAVGQAEVMGSAVRRVATEAAAAAGTRVGVRVRAAGDPWPENDSAALTVVGAGRVRWWHEGTGGVTPAGFEAWRGAGMGDVLMWHSPEVPDQAERAAIFRAVSGGMTLVVAPPVRVWDEPGWLAGEWANALPLAAWDDRTEPYVVVVDASGSMGRSGGGEAMERVRRAIAALPGDAAVRVVRAGSGGGSGGSGGGGGGRGWARVWVDGLKGQAALAVLPADLADATGPTVVEDVLLQELARPSRGVLVVTDGEIPFEREAELRRRMKASGHEVYWWLVRGEGKRAALPGVVMGEGGAGESAGGILTGLGKWRRADRIASVTRERVEVEWSPASGLKERKGEVSVWARAAATEGAGSMAQVAGSAHDVAAVARVGLGRVVAVSAEVGANVLAELAGAQERRWDASRSVGLWQTGIGPMGVVRAEGSAGDVAAVSRVTVGAVPLLEVRGVGVGRAWRLPEGVEGVVVATDASGVVLGQATLAVKGPAELDHVGIDLSAAGERAVYGRLEDAVRGLPAREVRWRGVFLVVGVVLAGLGIFVRR